MMANFDSILEGDIFRFLIGEYEVPLVIHTEALKISYPLYNLATGRMEESRLGYATIEDIEPKTMRLFIEYAYTGIYRIATENRETSTRHESPRSSAASKCCTRCSDLSSVVRHLTPYCAKASCRDGYLSNSYIFCIECGARSLDADCAYCEECRIVHSGKLAGQGVSVRTSSGPFTVKASNFAIDTSATDIEIGLRHVTLDDGSALEILNCRLTSSHPHVDAAIVFARKDMADAAVRFFHSQNFDKKTISAQLVAVTSKQLAFEQRKYDVGKIKHKDFSKNLKFRRPFIRMSGDLLAHAKLWVFADRYLIQDLKDLCLHMLHRELLFFNINRYSVLEIFELLSYVYDPENTRNSDEDTLDNGEELYVNELKGLAISYATCIIHELREFKQYRETLRNGGDLAADLGSLEL